MSGRRGFVYLLHLEGRINPDHPCRHYVGYTDDLGRRIAEHREGGPAAARLLQVAHERGIGFRVARVWRGDRGLERRIKRAHNGPAYCPVCGGRRWLDWADELPRAAVERLTGAAAGAALFFGGAPFLPQLTDAQLFGGLWLVAAVCWVLMRMVKGAHYTWHDGPPDRLDRAVTRGLLLASNVMLLIVSLVTVWEVWIEQ